jgi:conjugative relaxase-like TrwC/TraI family protein
VLTISRLSWWSINYYNDTANHAKQAAIDRRRANGGLGEYYTEGDTRVPTWLVVGDAAAVGEHTGLDGAALAGGFVDTETASRWLDDGIAPNGARGRAFTRGSVHGFDLTFAAPKSVSLLRALTDDIGEKVIQAAHMRAISAAMTYLHQHAGYTRMHNPATGTKDLHRLPGLVAIAYQHETSRGGELGADPHLHSHVIVPNRQARADGTLVSIDSKSLYHEAKAAGVIYQATLRHVLHAERGFEWQPVGEHTGMAEIAGVDADCIKAWSQRSTRLREWAKHSLAVVDGEPTPAQLAAAQKATRPAKPESLAWETLKEQWHADARGLVLDRDAHLAARGARRTAQRTPGRERVAAVAARIDKAAFTRADMVELIGAQLPVDAQGDPRARIERIVDTVGLRVSAPREAHEREGHEKYTLDAVIAEEQQIFSLVDERDNRARLDVRTADLDDLSADQQRAVANIAVSPFLVQPLQAPAGAGKTHCLRALRAGAHRAHKQVLVLAPTGKAVDAAMADGAGDRGLTVAKALQLHHAGKLGLDRGSVVIVDEASMVGTPELKTLLAATSGARAKTVLVGDPYQLGPVKARGGMFDHLCTELPWSQRLTDVWRIRDRAERTASLALRCGRGNRLRKAVGWYRVHDRLHTGDPIVMATDAHDAYLADRAAGKDALLVCDTWEVADALNRRLHDTLTTEGPTARCAREQTIRAGDIIISRHNDARIPMHAAPRADRDDPDQVRNGNRWRVAGIDQVTNRVAAERLTDHARVVFDGDYLREHVHLGYAVTVHLAQGVTADTAHAVIGESASRALAYVAMSGGRDANHAYIYTRSSGEADHDHTTPVADDTVHVVRRGTKYSAAHCLRMIAANDERPRTMHAQGEHTGRELLPELVGQQLDLHDSRRAARRNAWRQYSAAERARQAAYERMTTATYHSAERSRSRDQSHGLEL